MIASKLPGGRKAFLWFAAGHGIVVEIDHQPHVDDDALDQYRTRAVLIAHDPITKLEPTSTASQAHW